MVKGDWFQGSEIQELVVSKSVEEFQARAFAQCRSLTKVTFAEDSQLKTIGKDAFAYTSISEFAPPQLLASIGEGAFRGTKLQKFVTPKQIKTIGDYAFQDCLYLKKFVLSADI